MFGLEKRKIIRDTLRFTYRDHPHSRWWLCDDSLIGISRVIKETVCNPGGDPVADNVDIIRRAPRKVVYRIRDVDGGGSYICKAFFLDHLSHRLRHYAYGMDEASGFIRAKQMGIKTPAVCGYGQVYNKRDMVWRNMVILEDLCHCSTISELMDKASDGKRFELFNRTIPVFMSLYRANCNHIDANCNAMMLDADDSDSEIYLLDFQHAMFHKSESLEILMFETGYFARSCQKWLTMEMIYDWLKEIMHLVGVDDADRQAILKERFDYYFLSRGLSPTQSTLSRKQRKSIR